MLAHQCWRILAQLPVLTGDRHWATLTPHGLAVEIHLFRLDPDPHTGGS